MIAPLDFIFSTVGGGDEKEAPIMPHFRGGAGAIAAETFTKKCTEIKDNYGVPIGYSCVFTHNIEPFIHNKSASRDDDDVKEIDDDMFDTLYNRASVRASPAKMPKTKRVVAPKKARRVSKKAKKP